MEQQDPNEGSGLDPRAVPVAVASAAVVVLGLFMTYVNTTFGAIIVLIGLCGFVWVGRLAVKRDT